MGTTEKGYNMKNASYGAAVSAAAIALTTLISQAAGGPTSWNNAAGGFWGDNTNWNPMSVPNQSDPVLIDLAGTYTVSVNGTRSAATLDITNQMATLGIRNARQFNVFGDVLNDALIIINLESSVSATLFDFEASGILSGTGTLRLNSAASRSQLRTGASGVTLTNEGMHTIDGFGQISAELINNATVRANVPGNELLMLGSNKVNNDTMEAVATGIMDFNSLTLTQGPAGQVRASGLGSRIDLNSTTIVGGTVSSDTGGTIELLSATFDGVNFSGGTMNLQNARTLNVLNSISNDGTIVVNSEGSVSATQITFKNSGAFNGSGEIVLNSVGSRARLLTDPGFAMTNTTSHTIRGQGQIEANLINNGLVSADVPGVEMFMLVNEKTNNSTMEATNGGSLDFSSITVNNSGAQIVADDPGSRIDLNSTTVIGGDLLALNGSVVDVMSASLTGVNFEGLMNLRNARTLTITDSITNNGAIVVNPEASVSATQISFANDGALNGNGSVELNSFGSRARIIAAPGVTVTNPSTHTIFGRGQIEATLINNGLIRSDVLDQEMFFLTNNKTNNATIRAQDGGSLDFSGITVNNSAGDLIADGAGSRIDFNSTTVIGGDLLALNGAHVDVLTATLDGVNFDGLMNIRNARTLNISNSIINGGEIVVNSDSSVSATQINFLDTGSFFGPGSVRLNSAGSRSRILAAASDIEVTNESGHTIHGFGQIAAGTINDGLISADVSGQELQLLTGDMQNNSTIEAINDAIIDISGITVTQSPAATIIADGPGGRIDLNSATISGGVFSTVNGASVSTAAATLSGVESNALINLANAGTLNIENATENNGTIIVNETGSVSATHLAWLDDSALGGTGTVVLNSFNTRSRLLISGDATTATLGENQRLEGIGSVGAPLVHNGTTAPGLSIGTMFASQPITYTASSVFESEVDGSTADLLDSTSTIELNGELKVLYTDGFAPTGFWARKIMEGSDITEKFNAIDIPAPAAGFVTRVYNTGTELFVGQTCPSDTNLDGDLNFFDVSVFLNNYNAGDLAADLNGDGVLNFFDVSTFLNSYNMGC